MAQLRQINRDQIHKSSKSFNLFELMGHPLFPQLMVIFSALGLIAIGLVMVFSSSSITAYVEQGNAVSEIMRQIIFTAVGIALGALVAFCFSENFIIHIGSLFFWIICMILLVLTAAFGTEDLGATRWLVIGGVGIQPSEFTKIAIILMGAKVLSQYSSQQTTELQAIIKFFMLVIAPLVFVLFFQSDLGTTIICGIAIIVLFCIAGLNMRFILIVLGLCALLAVIFAVSTPYRLERLTNFLDPWADPQDAGYQLIHSFKALASGGILGTGIGNSFEKMLYLPEADTDFIFAIIGEEMGLVGTVLVIVLFIIFLWGSILIALQSQTRFGTLIAGSLGIMLVFQALLNMFCVVGLAPVTGKPLPFISSGGSSMISSCLIVGLILSVSINSQKKNQLRKRRNNLQVVTSSASYRNSQINRKYLDKTLNKTNKFYGFRKKS